MVLAGAERLLSQCRPSFYIEVGEEQNQEVTDVFKRHRYRLYIGDSEDQLENTSCVFNTFATPTETPFTNRGMQSQ